MRGGIGRPRERRPGGGDEKPPPARPRACAKLLQQQVSYNYARAKYNKQVNLISVRTIRGLSPIASAHMHLADGLPCRRTNENASVSARRGGRENTRPARAERTCSLQTPDPAIRRGRRERKFKIAPSLQQGYMRGCWPNEDAHGHTRTAHKDKPSHLRT